MARKQVAVDNIDFSQIGKQVDTTPISEEVNNSFLEYAFSVIYSRAIPDARDGLKPVHRRILYSMIESGYTPDKPHVKSAKIVGATMGTYHPHGDCLSGDTLVVTPTGETYTLKELTESKTETLDVLAVNERGDVVRAKASGFRIGQVTNKVFNILTVNGHTIQATANHPFLTADNEWVRAEDLEIGNVLKAGTLELNNAFSVNGDISLALNYVIAVEEVNLTTAQPMYDFTVEGHENLFVAKEIDGVLSLICVHNSAIYEAMVRLQQPFAMRVPLVDGHGNFGSSPDDSAAASRYTESRLHKNGQLFIGEIKEKAVDFRPNYDSTTEEPIVLPATFPNLLINGTTGIAVGMTTNIPSHNPDEIIEATRYLMAHPNAKLEKIMEMVPGPDFPTGGVIMGQEGITEAYSTGVGKITLRAKVEIEPTTGGRHKIIADELPYGVGAEKIIEKIKDGISAKRLIGISKFMDLSDRRLGTHLVIETKSGINPQTVLAQLYKYTQFETTFGVQSVALVHGQPRTLGIIELLQIFIDHRLDVVLRRSQNRLEKKEARRHIVEGMLKILANIDKVIALIRASADTAEAKDSLMKAFDLDDIQAEYVLSIPLRRLTKYDTLELNNEKSNLDKEITDLQEIINDPEVLRKLVSSELAEVKKQISSERRTVISGAADVEAEAKLLKAVVEAAATGSTTALQASGEPVEVFIDHEGNLTKKKPSIALGAIESPLMFIALNNKGEAHRVDVHAPTFGIKNVLAVAPNEAKGYLVMGTKKGVVKIANPDYPLRSDEFSLINLDADDEIVGAAWVENPADYNIVFVSSDSSFLKIEAEKVRPQGRTGGGMAGIGLEDGQHVVGFGVVRKDDLDAKLVTYTGVSVKTTPLGEYPTKGRATKGMRSHRFLKGEEKLVSVAVGSNTHALAGGKSTPLPPATNKRDGSGTPITIDKLTNGM